LRHARLGQGQHEFHFAIAENRHDGICDRADPQQCEVKSHELPPIRQLIRHHFARLDTKPQQISRGSLGSLLQFAVCQRRTSVGRSFVANNREPPWIVSGMPRKKLEQGLIAPESSGPHRLLALI
jgi:hypothetical protein